mgnify:CR=1 FL=1
MGLKDKVGQEFNKSSLDNTEVEYEHGKHPNSQKNLQKWEKGETGNPLGRPFKYSNIKKELVALGKEITHDYRENPLGTRKEVVLKKIWACAMRGDIQYVKILIYLGAFDE